MEKRRAKKAKFVSPVSRREQTNVSWIFIITGLLTSLRWSPAGTSAPPVCGCERRSKAEHRLQSRFERNGFGVFVLTFILWISHFLNRCFLQVAVQHRLVFAVHLLQLFVVATVVCFLLAVNFSSKEGSHFMITTATCEISGENTLCSVHESGTCA